MRLPTIALVLLATAGAARAADFSASPQLGYVVGEATYGLELEGLPGLPAGTGVGSQLDYPLDSLVAGLELRVGGRLSGERRWDLVLLGLTNLVSPFGTMDDADYFFADNQRQDFMYTESDSRGRFVLADLGFRLTLMDREVGRRQLAADVRVGYRHVYLDFDVYGGEGWALTAPDVREPLTVPDDLHVLHYDGHYYMPWVGLGVSTHWFGRFHLESEARLLVLVAHVHDDHVYRNKEGFGDAYGAGLLVGLTPRYVLVQREAWSLALGAELELQFVSGGSGKLKQRFYGDDPSIPGDETGVEVPDTDFRAKSLCFRAALAARFSF